MKTVPGQVNWLDFALGGLVLGGWWFVSARAFATWVYVALGAFILVPCFVQGLHQSMAFRHRIVVVSVAFLTYALLVSVGHPHPVEPSIAAGIGAFIGATLPPRHAHY